ncbi:MAG TPA: phytanoyl-CoA dioxygenase family protein [Polyangiaceae bacterium]|nr:phytanoyl-CoA dioxygenase family protein [Polyangiaceae bacterium]
MLDSAPSPRQPLDLPSLRRNFADEGYIVLRGVISKPELATIQRRLTEEFDAWKKSNESFRGGGMLSGHLNCYPGELARGVYDELQTTGMLDLARTLFPTDPKATRIGCNFNLPGSVAQHYHMDGIFLESFMVVNVAVVDTRIENGAIDVVPKTHKRFYRYWEFAAGRVNRGSLRLPMSAGDVLIRTSTLWHRGMPNRTSVARPMLAVTLGEKGVSTDDPFSANGGRTQFQTNWFKTDLIGRLRERTTVAAPITYSAYRFAHSLLSNKGYSSF